MTRVEIDTLVLHHLVFCSLMNVQFWARLEKNEPGQYTRAYREALADFHHANHTLRTVAPALGVHEPTNTIDDVLMGEPRWPQCATKAQIDIIANAAVTRGDAGQRSLAKELGHKLFPNSVEEIELAITNHPVNLNWNKHQIDSA